MSEPGEDGGPAFPVFRGIDYESVEGMSLRDWFAGRALPYICQIGPDGSTKGTTVYESIALDAYAMADAMLKARGPQ